MTSHTRCFVLVQTAANMAPPRKKRAKAWLYFTRKDDNIATCNSCKVSISSKGGTTTNMQKHLATQHGIHLQECHVFDTLRSSDASESPATGGGASPATGGGGGGCIAGNRGGGIAGNWGCIAGNRGASPATGGGASPATGGWPATGGGVHRGGGCIAGNRGASPATGGGGVHRRQPGGPPRAVC